MKKGFTLAEVLVTMAVIAVVGAITLPIMTRIKPNEEVIMLKKAYYLIGRTVNELINDDEFYPDDGQQGDNGGFSNTSLAQYHGHTVQGISKFCELFAFRMNVQGAVQCENPTDGFADGQPPVGNFTSTDGMVWIVPIGDFASGIAPNGDGTNIAQTIWVDVNGNKGSNCSSGNNNCDRPDRFPIAVDRWGRIYVEDEITRLYLQTADNTKTHAEIMRNGNNQQAQQN